MIDLNKTYKTAEGHKVKLMGKLLPNESYYPVIGAIFENNIWKVHQWAENTTTSYTGRHGYSLQEVKPMTIEEAIIFMTRPSNDNVTLVLVGTSSTYFGSAGARCLGMKLDENEDEAGSMTFKLRDE